MHLTKWQLWEQTNYLPSIAFAYAYIEHSWADQLLPQLLIEHFDSLPSLCKHFEHTVSHFSYAPLIKCTITRKRNIIVLFWEYGHQAHLWSHQHLKFHCDQIRNECKNGSWRALHSKHHFTLHYFEWNSVHNALFSGSHICYASDDSRFILSIM